MAWQTDQPPVNYLKRRIIYYKKKKGTVKGFLKNEWFIKKYGRKNFSKMVAQRVKEIDNRIEEFENAIKKLEA